MEGAALGDGEGADVCSLKVSAGSTFGQIDREGKRGGRVADRVRDRKENREQKREGAIERERTPEDVLIGSFAPTTRPAVYMPTFTGNKSKNIFKSIKSISKNFIIIIKKFKNFSCIF